MAITVSSEGNSLVSGPEPITHVPPVIISNDLWLEVMLKIQPLCTGAKSNLGDSSG